MRYSCKAVVGHGQKCEPNYQCDACAAKQEYKPRIEHLEAALREIAYTEPEDKYWPGRIARKALEEKDE